MILKLDRMSYLVYYIQVQCTIQCLTLSQIEKSFEDRCIMNHLVKQVSGNQWHMPRCYAAIFSINHACKTITSSHKTMIEEIQSKAIMEEWRLWRPFGRRQSRCKQAYITFGCFYVCLHHLWLLAVINIRKLVTHSYKMAVQCPMSEQSFHNCQPSILALRGSK